MQILMIIPIMLPSLLPYTVPTTTLFTTCIVYGRLSADNEILALKAAGIHILHVIWPAVLLGIITSTATMVFFIDTIPATGSMLRNPRINDLEELLYTMLRKDGYIKHGKINYEIYVKTIQGRKLLDAQFMRRAPDGKGFDLIARAKEAELRVDLGHNRLLIDMRQCHIQGIRGDIAFVESRIWEVEISDFNGSADKFRAMDMTWPELHEYQEKWTKELERLSHQMNIIRSKINLGGGTPDDKNHLRAMEDARQNRENGVFSIQAEYHLRPALALGCLCFAMVGCPVGIWFNKSDYLSAFIVCFLPIVTIYYPLMFCMSNMASSGKLPPWLAIYNADAMMLIAGGILFHRLARN
jgi:lipopolysaccharide export system permease protein